MKTPEVQPPAAAGVRKATTAAERKPSSSAGAASKNEVQLRAAEAQRESIAAGQVAPSGNPAAASTAEVRSSTADAQRGTSQTALVQPSSNPAATSAPEIKLRAPAEQNEEKKAELKNENEAAHAMPARLMAAVTEALRLQECNAIIAALQKEGMSLLEAAGITPSHMEGLVINNRRIAAQVRRPLLRRGVSLAWLRMFP